MSGKTNVAHLTAALELAKRGLNVFPIRAINNGKCECGDIDCDRPGKHPAVKWAEKATTDVEQIRQWWTEKPNRGIGIACGERSGITVLDIDGDIGLETLAKLQNGAPMPATPTVESRPGHFHYYFAHKPGISSEAGKLGKGIDVRNDGFYVVAPPSPHITGGRYKWVGDTAKLAYAPWPTFLETSEGKAKKKVGRPPKEQFNPANPKDVSSLGDALGFIDPDDIEKWWSVGWILGRAYKQSDAGFALYSAWAGRSRKYDAKRTRQHYYEESRKRKDDGEVLTTASIYKWATEGGWTGVADPAAVEERQFNIFENPFQESKMVAEFAAACAGAPDVFTKDGRLIRIVRYGLSGDREGGGDVQRDATAFIVADYDPDTLSVALGDIAAFWSAKGSGYVRSAFNRRCVGTFLSCREFDGVRPLDAFVAHPTLRADGTLITDIGYDPLSRLYLTSEVPGLQVDADFTRKQATQALKHMLEPFSQYPWASARDRAVFVASAFTVGLRHLFDVVPLFAFSSPKHGTGKTLLTECLSRLWYGITLSKATWTGNPEEMEKRIAAFLLAGDRIVCLDNVTEGQRLEDSTLNKVLTSRRNTFRLLGRTERLELTNEATWFATGNQLRLSGDISRRSLLCYIDSHTANPNLRQFSIENLPGYIMQHRAQLMSCALSIAASWMKAGRPVVSKPARGFGSFIDWFDVIRPLLLWAGEEDIAGAVEASVEEDADEVALNSFANSLRRALPPEDAVGLTTPEIWQLLTKNAEARSAFMGVVGSEPNLRTVGDLLWRCANKVFISDNPGHEFSIVRDVSGKVLHWRIKWFQ